MTHQSGNNTESVYETADLPEADQAQAHPETFESADIELVHLDVNAAFERFKDRTLNTDDVDFADWLTRRRRQGYGGGKYVLEVIGPDALQEHKESALQKFNRLHYEINELAEQLNAVKNEVESGKSDETQAIDLKQVVALQAQLKTLQVEQILGEHATQSLIDPQAANFFQVMDAMNKLKAAPVTQGKKAADKDSSAKGSIQFELLAQTTSAVASTNTPKVAELEDRLAKLERSIGTGSEKMRALCGVGVGEQGQPPSSLSDAVQLLGERVQLLDAAHVDAVEARLTALLLKHRQLQDHKKTDDIVDSDQMHKVNELYELMGKWQPLCDALPDLVARLAALQQLHEQAMQSSQAMTQLDAGEQQLTKALDANTTLLNDLRSSLSDNMQQMKTNMDSLDARLKAIGK